MKLIFASVAAYCRKRKHFKTSAYNIKQQQFSSIPNPCGAVAFQTKAEGTSGIVSSDVVGYTTTATLDSGNKAIGVSFNAVSGTLNLQDVKVVGYTGAFEGNVNMQTLDAFGYTDKTFFWVDLPKDEDDPDSEAFYGWYDENDELAEKDLAIGEGLWGFSDSSAYYVEFPAISL